VAAVETTSEEEEAVLLEVDEEGPVVVVVALLEVVVAAHLEVVAVVEVVEDKHRIGHSMMTLVHNRNHFDENSHPSFNFSKPFTIESFSERFDLLLLFFSLFLLFYKKNRIKWMSLLRLENVC
jgi:hypothetical protein